MPPSRPFSGRRRNSTRPSARTATKAAPRRNLPSRFGALRGKVSGVAARARHDMSSFHGQSAQAGRFGVQMRGAEIHQRLREVAGAAAAADSDRGELLDRGFAAGNSSSTANSRATTRSTLPSTGTAGASNAIAAIAAAV